MEQRSGLSSFDDLGLMGRVVRMLPPPFRSPPGSPEFTGLARGALSSDWGGVATGPRERAGRMGQAGGHLGGGPCAGLPLPGLLPEVKGSYRASKGFRSVFVGQVFLLEALGTNAKQPHMFRQIVVRWPRRRRRQGQKTIVFMNMCGCLVLVPQASKNHLAQKTCRDPFEPFLSPNPMDL